MIGTLWMVSTLAGGFDPDPADGAHPPLVYKILTRPETERFQANGRFEGSPKDLEDGFVHLSTHRQLTRTVDLHFAGHAELFLAAVDVRAAGAALRWERSPRNGQVFPHLYGVLDASLVTGLAPLRRDEAGGVIVPESLKAPAAAAPARAD